MGALAAPKPSPTELLRNRTNYDQGTGYALLFHAQTVDIIRLSSGPVCTALLLMINAHAERGAGRGGKYPDAGWTPGFSLDEWAELCRASVRDIQRQRDYLVARKIVECKKSKDGFAFRLRYREWAQISDYDDWWETQLKRAEDEPETEPDPEDPSGVPVKPGTVRLVKAPIRVAQGKSSKGVRVNCGVKSIRLDNRSKIDLSIDLVVKAGELWFTAAPTLEDSGKKAKSYANKGVSNEQPDTGVVLLRKNSAGPARQSKGETDPRAIKLCNLFDPLLQRWGSKLLSPDTVALRDAVRAIEDTPHEYVIHFLNVGGREKRSISGPRAVVKILEECRRNYLAGGAKPPKRLDKEDLAARIQKEREELARKRAAVRRGELE